MVAAVWGSTVVVMKSAFETLPALTVVSIRLMLTALALLLAFPRLLRMTRAEATPGIGLGLLLAAGLVTQTLGLTLIAPSTSGFLTATYVVVTALITAVVLKHRQPVTIWLAVAATVAGVTVLASGHGGESADLVGGTALTLLSAVIYAVHIVVLSRVARPATAARITLLQALTGGAVGVALWPFVGEAPPPDPVLWAQLGYLGIVCGALALLLQSWAQSHLAAIPAAIIMCSEPVWAAALSVGFGFETFTAAMVIGGSLVVGALLLTVIGPRSDPERSEALAHSPQEVL